MSGKLRDRVAIVTGASKGLGKAMAIELAAEGAQVALVSRDRALLDGVAQEIRGKGGDARVFVADVASEQQVRQLEKDVIAEFGSLHVLIHNAGINLRKPITDFTIEEW